MNCPKCDVPLEPGKAIEQTGTGIPDFPGDTADSRGQTFHPGGPGRLVDVLKCPECGWSVTA